jgi:methionyl-tRNA synthetase
MTTKEKVFIGVAWPYANNSLHLGHLAGSLLAPDIFARYNRMRGRQVLMVSGSDEHGTPIMVTARKENITPAEVAERYHKEHVANMQALGISFDLFYRTSHPNHAKVVQEFFLKLLEKGHIFKETMNSQYCSKCAQFLPDRYVEGTCPHCKAPGARGDQCDACGRVLDPMDLIDPVCKLCGTKPVEKETEHFFFRLSAFEQKLLEWVSKNNHWRSSVKSFAESRLKEGLKDRPITRDLTWGITIPLPGMEAKRIYVWFEAVIGYLSASKEWASRAKTPDAWTDYWLDPKVRHYYFLGKDNIPFHTIIWPAMIMAHGDYNLPYDVPANEYLTISKAKMSKSTGTLIPLPYMLSKVAPDALRYYLTTQMPEYHDADFSYDDLIERNNKELLNTLGNFFNRALLFTFKNFGEMPPKCVDGKSCPPEIDNQLKDAEAKIRIAHECVTSNLEACRFKNALTDAMALAIFANQLFQSTAPFKLISKEKEQCGCVLHTHLKIAKALAILLQPFIPHISQKVWYMLGFDGNISEAKWEDATTGIPVGQKLRKPEILVEKLEPEIFGEIVQAAPAQSTEPLFNKINLKVGLIEKCDTHPNAVKLQVLTVNFGTETRQIVTGLRDHYKNEELQGLKAVFVTNLKPAKLRGVDSNGMILAASDTKVVAAVVLEEGASPGERVLAEGIPAWTKEPAVLSIDEFKAVPLKAHNVQGTTYACFIDGKTPRPLHTEKSNKKASPNKSVEDGAGIH